MTPMLADLVPPQIMESLTDVIPLRRMTEASEVARLVRSWQVTPPPT